ncbi:MAG: cell division protein FtsQ/DivIB [Rhodovarius sp.]|nr:cell division protein FtsQ/DivIB [Rhodovarius sp.]MDW8314751.1 cell division protein FtsQ/DivIB [Rhodovarius sp.]
MAASAALRARAKPSSAPPRRPSALRLWLRRQRALLRPLLLGLVGLCGLGLLAAAVVAADPVARLEAAAQAFWRGGFGFTVERIEVEGRAYMPREVFDTALGVSIGDPTLGFDPKAARARLEASPWVVSARVERHLPGTIRVFIVERQAFAIWQHQGRFRVIDRSGRDLEVDNPLAFGPLPLVVGHGANTAAAALIDALRRSEETREVARRVQAAVRVSDRRWNLRLANGTDILLPEGQEAAAIARLAELQARERLLDRPLAAIDMRLPDRLVLRPLPAAAPAAPPAPAPARSPRG